MKIKKIEQTIGVLQGLADAIEQAMVDLESMGAKEDIVTKGSIPDRWYKILAKPPYTAGATDMMDMLAFDINSKRAKRHGYREAVTQAKKLINLVYGVKVEDDSVLDMFLEMFAYSAAHAERARIGRAIGYDPGDAMFYFDWVLDDLGHKKTFKSLEEIIEAMDEYKNEDAP